MSVDPYVCAQCGTRYVVPSMARWCERRDAQTPP